MPQSNNLKKTILNEIASKRYENHVYRKNKKKAKRRREIERNINSKQLSQKIADQIFGKNFTYLNVIEKWMPVNLLYILKCPKSDLNENALSRDKVFNQKKPLSGRKILYVPQTFSIIDNPEESYAFIKQAILALLFGKYKSVYFSYQNCQQLDVGAQVVLDIVKKEALSFINKCQHSQLTKLKLRSAKEVGLTDVHQTIREIQKFLASVGSLAVHADVKLEFEDIIPYRLCTHSRDERFNRMQSIRQKEIDTSNLADYVINSLARLNKKLSPEKIDDLCTIIGEILINAEEHSTTHNRISIGYFQEKRTNDSHVGIFRLEILNFGKTIYETFAEADRPNEDAITKMRRLSEKYTKNNWFTGKKFEEENLWTLYALQEGITSIPDKKRGNGCIQFIDSFFSLKGNDKASDEKSKMTILSGNTYIIFDGTYRITEKESDGQKFKFMTFNESGSIENLPDKNYVKYSDIYFPGTLISAKILLSEDDFIEDAN